MVNVRADNLEDIADSMASDNIGLNPVHGHVAVLRRMASSMRAEARMVAYPRGGLMSSVYASAEGGSLGAAVAASMGGLKPSGLPQHIDRMLRASNVAIPAAGPVCLVELDTVLAGMATADRVCVKHTLAALGRLVA